MAKTNMSEKDKEAILLGYKSGESIGVFFLGLMVTAILAYVNFVNMRDNLRQEVRFESIQLQLLFESRLRTQAQVIRNGVGLFATSDTVTPADWKLFYDHSRINIHYPGIQGFGYAHIIPPDLLEEHIQHMRNAGYHDYTVTPEYDRDIYTSIVYLQPFTGRNLRAFGYDMFSDPVRQIAMQTAIDSNYASISGKVVLKQETDDDVQPGFLIYAPVYHSEMPLNTVEERRAAAKGWVYSPYRIYDLTEGIFDQWQMTRLPGTHFQIYDGEVISEETLLYNSRNDTTIKRGSTIYTETLPIRLNEVAWTLVTSSEETSFWLRGNMLLVIFSGLTISMLLYLLAAELVNARTRTQQIRALNQKLEKTNADKDRFISILGHDLKNPFNSMLGLLDILLEEHEDLDKEQAREYLRITNDVARNTYKMLDDLLEWARLQTGRISFEPMQYLLNNSCQDVIKQVSEQARTKQVSINCEITDNVMVYADHKMLRTVMRNLITNAIKFSHPGGQVTVSTVSQDGKITVCVSDQGVGIEPDIKSQLFDITKIVTNRGTAGEKGSGLGLILCKEFVEMHGGTIGVETQPGKGSRFCFTIPEAGNQG